MSFDILVAGVGGQGVVFASRILALAGMERYGGVLVSETIGMAQRGGSVVTHIRMGDDAMSPLILKKSASLILALEPAEAMRALPWLGEEGCLVTERRDIQPAASTLSAKPYDAAGILEYISASLGKRAVVLESARYKNSANMFLTGAACGAEFLPFGEEELISALGRAGAVRFLEANEAALRAGVAEARTL